VPTLLPVTFRPSLRVLLAALACLAAAGMLAVMPHLLGHVGSALASLRGAEPGWLALAAAGYAAGYLTSVGAWRTAIAAAGGRIGFRAALARLGIGSIVNTVAPAHVGDAVKVALLSDSLTGSDRIWTAGGLWAAVAASRACAIAALVVAASLAGALPLWPALLLVGVAGALVAVSLSPLPLRRFHRVAHLLAGLAALARAPRRAIVLLAWSSATTAARLAATVALAEALRLPHPLVAGLLIVTAVDVAGALPLTPGNIGVAGGAVAVALASKGIGATQAMGAGFAIQALETMVSLGAGLVGVAHFAGSGRFNPWLLRAAAVGAAVVLAAGGAALVVALV
jgi:uncharacterized membrane protein YbhN (UPF0104 family)